MARIIYQRNRIDPTKISGPYSLLAVMLLVAEILFAIWFYKAESSIERSIAGLANGYLFRLSNAIGYENEPILGREKS